MYVCSRGAVSHNPPQILQLVLDMHGHETPTIICAVLLLCQSQRRAQRPTGIQCNLRLAKKFSGARYVVVAKGFLH